MSCARAGPSVCWLCTAEECCGLGRGRQSGGWGGGRRAGPRVLGKRGGRGLSGAFLAYFRSIPVCFKMRFFPPSLLFATWQCSRANGREEKEATRSTSCRPRDAGCGRPFASGEIVKAVFLKKDNSRLLASCRARRCVIPAALKDCTKSFAQQRGVCVCLGHRRYAVMTVYTPRAAVRVFRLFPSVALQLAASVRGNRPSSLLFADGRQSRWTEVRFISGSSPCWFAFTDSISRAPVGPLR